jgi:AraC family transcriptional activator FtrA
MHRVVALVRSVQSTFELGCADEVFGMRRPGLERHYEFAICARTPGRVETSAGYSMQVEHGLELLDAADTVIIPGWSPVEAPLESDTRAALRRAHRRGARMVTICSGVFALARTGLLDGRSATAHTARIDQLRKEFPKIRVEEALFVDHGDVATSSGGGAGLDLCLHLVQKDHGADYARRLAENMVLPQHVRAPCTPSGFDALAQWVDDRLHEPLGVRDLATRLNMSPRTLARRTAQELGTSPGEWLLERRLTAARDLLSTTDLTVEAVAARVGLGSAVNLRRHFHRQYGTTPGAFRRSAS